jgi:hypothetical protein
MFGRRRTFVSQHHGSGPLARHVIRDSLFTGEVVGHHLNRLHILAEHTLVAWIMELSPIIHRSPCTIREAMDVPCIRSEACIICLPVSSGSSTAITVLPLRSSVIRKWDTIRVPRLPALIRQRNTVSSTDLNRAPPHLLEGSITEQASARQVERT